MELIYSTITYIIWQAKFFKITTEKKWRKKNNTKNKKKNHVIFDMKNNINNKQKNRWYFIVHCVFNLFMIFVNIMNMENERVKLNMNENSKELQKNTNTKK